MTDSNDNTDKKPDAPASAASAAKPAAPAKPATPAAPDKAAALHVAPSPHFGTTGRSTRWMMLDVILALLPAVGVSLYVFGAAAAMVFAVSIGACLGTELIFQLLRGRRVSILDGSALVTGMILAMSLPWSAPWWIPLIGGAVAIGLGKMVFGGLGANIFNPAMVGRAFLMICFAAQLASYTDVDGKAPQRVVTEGLAAGGAQAVTTATPMAAGKHAWATLEDGQTVKVAFPLKNLLMGNVNGSVGETGALALLLGGLFLCLRRTADWRMPVGALAAAMVIATINWFFGSGVVLSPLHHLLGGALIFGSCFIITDPVSSPLSHKGRWVYGILFGCLCMVIRLFSAYPEGVMFSVLLVNAVTPLINRWTIPRPVGGRVSYAR